MAELNLSYFQYIIGWIFIGIFSGVLTYYLLARCLSKKINVYRHGSNLNMFYVTILNVLIIFSIWIGIYFWTN